jgi:hypothetical protein
MRWARNRGTVVTLVYAGYSERVMFAEEAYLRQRYGGDLETWAAVAVR